MPQTPRPPRVTKAKRTTATTSHFDQRKKSSGGTGSWNPSLFAKYFEGQYGNLPLADDEVRECERAIRDLEVAALATVNRVIPKSEEEREFEIVYQQAVNGDTMTARQRAFVEFFLRWHNPFRAAAAAGYRCPELAGRLVVHEPSVRAEIQRRIATAAHKHKVTTNAIIAELAAIGFSNMMDFVDVDEDGGAHITFKWADRKSFAALKEMTSETYLIPTGKGEERTDVRAKKVTIKMADKLRALEILGKIMHLYNDEVSPEQAQHAQQQTQQALLDAVRAMKQLEAGSEL